MPSTPPATTNAPPPRVFTYVSTGSSPTDLQVVQMGASQPALWQVQPIVLLRPHRLQAPPSRPVSGAVVRARMPPPIANSKPRAKLQKFPLTAQPRPMRRISAPAPLLIVTGVLSGFTWASIFMAFSFICTRRSFGLMPFKVSSSPASNQIVAQSPQMSIFTSGSLARSSDPNGLGTAISNIIEGQTGQLCPSGCFTPVFSIFSRTSSGTTPCIVLACTARPQHLVHTNRSTPSTPSADSTLSFFEHWGQS